MSLSNDVDLSRYLFSTAAVRRQFKLGMPIGQIVAQEFWRGLEAYKPLP